MFSKPPLDLETIYEEWEDNNRDILKWIRVAYEDSDPLKTQHYHDDSTNDLLKKIIIPIYYTDTPISSMSLSQFLDTINGFLYYIFCQPDSKRDNTWVDSISSLLEQLRTKAYYFAVNQLPTSILDVVEFQTQPYNTTNPENIPDEEDYNSDSEKRALSKQKEEFRRKILEMKSKSLFEVMNHNASQIKCASFEYSDIMANYFKEIDFELKKTSEISSIDFYHGLNFETIDLVKLRKFLCEFFKNSPKLKDMAKTWNDFLYCKECFIHSVCIRTNQSSRINQSTVMTYMFSDERSDQAIPCNIKEMMKSNNRLYSDCLLYCYSKQSSRGDFIGALIRPKTIGGVCMNYISTTGEWEVTIPENNGVPFRFPSLCHGFSYIRKEMKNQTKLVYPKNVPKGFSIVDESDLFNLPEIIDFDQMDEYVL
jgi:hypothetical protein